VWPVCPCACRLSRHDSLRRLPSTARNGKLTKGNRGRGDGYVDACDRDITQSALTRYCMRVFYPQASTSSRFALSLPTVCKAQHLHWCRLSARAGFPSAALLYSPCLAGGCGGVGVRIPPFSRHGSQQPVLTQHRGSGQFIKRCRRVVVCCTSTLSRTLATAQF
jgi:hypothetical protein